MNKENKLSDKEIKERAAKERQEELFDTPTIPGYIYDSLPSLLKDGCNLFEDDSREKDVFFTAALTVISCALPNYYNMYDNRKNYPHLYAMVVAPPASGKGVASFALKYLDSIDRMFEEEYKLEMEEYNQKKLLIKSDKQSKELEHIPKPKRRKMRIAGNNSASSFIQVLSEAKNGICLFETEADTLASAFKQEWGNFSDSLRKAYHHESISIQRKDDHFDLTIHNPKLSVFLSGTPRQVGGMQLHNPENGLQSRFVFYCFTPIPKFKNIHDKDNGKLDQVLTQLGERAKFVFIQMKNEPDSFKFVLSQNQWKFFERIFQKLTNKVVRESNAYGASLVIRAAVGTIRIASILAILEELDSKILIPNKITCTWRILRNSIRIMEIYLRHSEVIFKSSKLSKADESMHKYLDFLKALPDGEFTRKEALEIANDFDFADRTLDRRLSKLIREGFLESIRFGAYKKKGQ